jgi:HPt (histidine-containing phosphotransfer) domain-containing protein
MVATLPQRIDFLRLAMNLGGKQKAVVEMLDLFMKSTKNSLQHMENALAENNIITWLQATHKIKGASQNITAKRMMMLCVEAEEIKELPHPQSSAVLYNMHKEYALLRAAIDQQFTKLL